MTLFHVLMIGFASAGFVMASLVLLYGSEVGKRSMISSDPHRSVPDAKLYRDVALNMTVSVALIFGTTYGLEDHLFYTGDTPVWVMVVEAVAVIFIYDFAYYFVHRYPFHEWKLTRHIHAVHHAARNPRTVDALLLHPVETAAGLLLLFGSIAAVGGIHLYTFAPIFVAYTTLNVLNHAGMNVERFPFETLGILAVKHDRHHHSLLSGNYASITPLPDIVFGTVE